MPPCKRSAWLRSLPLLFTHTFMLWCDVPGWQVLALPAEKKERSLRRWTVAGAVVVAALATLLPKLLKK